MKNIKKRAEKLRLVANDCYLEPYEQHLLWRKKRSEELLQQLAGEGGSLLTFANGHHYFGLQKQKDCWIFREWAPNASAIFLVGTFNHWQSRDDFQLKRTPNGDIWEITLPLNAITHGDLYKLRVHWPGGEGERIPAYAFYVVQDAKTKIFSACVWDPSSAYQMKYHSPDPALTSAPLIYEAHVGMAQAEECVHTYNEFRMRTLPRIKKAGYNTIQLMAIQEHPYYGSFGYQVSNFFAPSSRFGTPCELRRLIDEAHGMGMRVIMDMVLSHSVKNQAEGLGLFDGTQYQYFHDGSRGLHPAWDSLCFDYGKHHVLHFLLSNCKYWAETFHFDGYRFDGVTSMLYHDHGLGKNFNHYDDYFNANVDEDAVAFLSLANQLLHNYRADFITIAEEVSGMPGLAANSSWGGVGFDYRMGMGIPDYWIKLLKHTKDEHWSVEAIYHEHVNRRRDEKIIAYCESHDQAMVGDKTLAFWLMDAEMYWSMSKESRGNIIIDRGIALHKMLRLFTCTTARGGYLNFIGNEWAHPEWIDFPREGNRNSFHYARRQWQLLDDQKLCYHYLGDFDQEMIAFVDQQQICSKEDPTLIWSNLSQQLICFKRGHLYFIFNFHPHNSYTDYAIEVPPGEYQQVFNSDEERFGGHQRIPQGQKHHARDCELFARKAPRIFLYLPARTALILRCL
ncbi:MAG: alpha amylase C-terminal domain-containing protein [Oligoflexia bacterium]|nr:alpha amylase C-terminal domain-containing protein [Oligoflexia bacterium]MBF0365613.1 alpha amylase C-terminal domain-containing protein [Oligoflexia bacterium]